MLTNHTNTNTNKSAIQDFLCITDNCDSIYRDNDHRVLRSIKALFCKESENLDLQLQGTAQVLFTQYAITLDDQIRATFFCENSPYSYNPDALFSCNIVDKVNFSGIYDDRLRASTIYYQSDQEGEALIEHAFLPMPNIDLFRDSNAFIIETLQLIRLYLKEDLKVFSMHPLASIAKPINRSFLDDVKNSNLAVRLDGEDLLKMAFNSYCTYPDNFQVQLDNLSNHGAFMKLQALYPHFGLNKWNS